MNLGNSSSVVLSIHSHATSLSPHLCIVGPSSRVCMVVSAGSRSIRVFSLTLFSFPSPVPFLCPVDSFTLSRANVTNLVFPASAPLFFHCGRTVEMSWINLPQGLPPTCASPSVDVSQGVDHRIGSFVTDPFHGLPHAPCNYFIQKGQSHLFPYLVDPMFLLLVF